MDDVRNVDWEKYLERKHSLFLFPVMLRTYGVLLKESTGFEFVNQLYTHQQGHGTFYRSTTEMKQADAFYLQHVKHGKRLDEWKQKGMQLNASADPLIHKFKTENPTIDASTYRKYLAECEAIILYDTIIPYRVLSAINSAIDAGEPAATYAVQTEQFASFRANTKYPHLESVVFKAFWKAAAEKTGLDEHTLSFATPDELGELFEKGQTPNVNELEQRKEGCVFWENPNTQAIQFSYDAEWLNELVHPHAAHATHALTELKGNVASPGKVKGKVKIVNSTADMLDFEAGSIIVSINTNPSIMPVLLKCAGIVTDEGGIMCHAAIVSRELNVPCVVGTRHATKVLKNGDYIELDAHNGTVKILAKA